METILGNIATRSQVDLASLLTDGALARLVIASGGVPRDYLRLAGEAIKHARNRGPSAKAGSEKVMAEDINSAAGQTAETKLDDLREDAPADAANLERLLEDLAEFCRNNKSAYFLVDGHDEKLSSGIEQLQDLRFVHLLFDGESVPDLGSRRHKVLLLDVGISVSGVPFRLISKGGRTDLNVGDASSDIRTVLARNMQLRHSPERTRAARRRQHLRPPLPVTPCHQRSRYLKATASPQDPPATELH